jgi:hypothetical protein
MPLKIRIAIEKIYSMLKNGLTEPKIGTKIFLKWHGWQGEK